MQDVKHSLVSKMGGITNTLCFSSCSHEIYGKD